MLSLAVLFNRHLLKKIDALVEGYGGKWIYGLLFRNVRCELGLNWLSNNNGNFLFVSFTIAEFELCRKLAF